MRFNPACGAAQARLRHATYSESRLRQPQAGGGPCLPQPAPARSRASRVEPPRRPSFPLPISNDAGTGKGKHNAYNPHLNQSPQVRRAPADERRLRNRVHRTWIPAIRPRLSGAARPDLATFPNTNCRTDGSKAGPAKGSALFSCLAPVVSLRWAGACLRSVPIKGRGLRWLS